MLYPFQANRRLLWGGYVILLHRHRCALTTTQAGGGLLTEPFAFGECIMPGVRCPLLRGRPIQRAHRFSRPGHSG